MIGLNQYTLDDFSEFVTQLCVYVTWGELLTYKPCEIRQCHLGIFQELTFFNGGNAS